jgi:putative chitinase
MRSFLMPESRIPAVTPELVAQMFPVTPVANIRANLPHVLNALVAPQLATKQMILVTLATIRAETESFRPVSEGVSRFNTSPGAHPFDRYDNRGDLGNQGPPDGERFRGRGFLQLTGRANYLEHGRAIGLGEQLIADPELANDPDVAARLLASFLKSREKPIQAALLRGDLAAARRLVNGGSNGLARFTDAWRRGEPLIPEALEVH